MLGQAALGRLFYYLTLDKVKSCGILGIRKFVEELDMEHQTTVMVDELQHNLSTLHCPKCQENYLHQGIVELYTPTFRYSQDIPHDRVTIVDGENIFHEVIPSQHGNNPSSERDGLIIHFVCEHCPDTDFKLRIYQHKGNTLMDWRYEDGTNT